MARESWRPAWGEVLPIFYLQSEVGPTGEYGAGWYRGFGCQVALLSAPICPSFNGASRARYRGAAGPPGDSGQLQVQLAF